MLLLIYGLTFSSVGLLTATLIPEVRARIVTYFDTVNRTQQELEDLFIAVKRRRLMALYVAMPIVTTVLAWCFLPKLLALPLGVIVGFVFPRAYVRMAEAKRRRQFQAQLVDSLMVMSGSLKASLSIPQALEVVAEESVPPMSEEIGLILKEARMGLSLDEALKRFKKRMPVEELNLVVTALLVTRETGGDVTGVFTKLIETIRDRQKLRERLKTLTLVPRLQGWIMAMIPIVFAVFVTGVNGQYFEKFTHDPAGQLIACLAAGMWVISLILIVWFSRMPM